MAGVARGAVAALCLLACSTLARADTFRVLAGNRESIQARIDLIQQAEREIVIAHYAMDKGRVPASLLAVLCEAAQQGVRVRLIVDGLKSRYPPELFEYLESQGVRVRSYHPLRATRPLWLNRRLHIKLLVVDGRQMIVGSRNLQDEHFGLSDKNFLDCDAYLRGASADHAQRYFDWLWQTDDVRPIRYIDSPTYGGLNLRPWGSDSWSTAWRNVRDPQDIPPLLDRSLATLVRCHGIRLHTGNDWSAGASHEVSAAVWHDLEPSKCRHRVEDAMLEWIDSARCHVLIETGYPALTRKTQHAILAAQRRGVQVTLVTNSLRSIDNVAVYAAYQNLKGSLLRAGVRIWEYRGPETLHAKMMVVDGARAVIGSYNFDPRSAYSNLELVVAVEGRAAAAALQAAVSQHMRRARRVRREDEAISLPRWLGGTSDPGDPEAPVARRTKLQLYRLTMPTFRWLL